MKYLVLIVVCVFFISCKDNSGNQTISKTNHLVNETSAYLLQHAHNPVDWFPWNEEALQKAKTEKKLIVVSIGYSSCHWCHVMERESFSDTAVSRLMNAHFVNIKVDREERPDVDQIYMTACQIMNPDGGCGWPLNAITLSDGRPVWVGTYLNRDEWMNLLTQINDLYHEDQNELQKIANQLSNHLQSDHRFKLTNDHLNFEATELKTIQQKVLNNLDLTRGGKKGDIKFPLPPLLRYQLEYAGFVTDKTAANWVDQTLKQLMNGGINDQLAGGFARYSTDPNWRVPHFEKMLYDNAQLISLYADAYKKFKTEAYKNTLIRTLNFMQSDFTSGDGKYYSSFDAETEGEEGKYYVWTLDEVKQILADHKLIELAIKVYHLKDEGNWEKGKNVLFLTTSIQQLSKELSKDVKSIQDDLETIRLKLLEVRKQRKAPKRDQKIICAWNAMMAIALADASAALGDENYKKEALKTGNFLVKEMLSPEGKLYRTVPGSKNVQYGFLDDYAFTILAMIRLYEISFDESWLQTALKLCEQSLKSFTDEDGVYFYYNASEDTKLIARKKEMVDQVISSSNSVMADVLHKLGLYFYNTDYLKRSQHMVKGMIDGPAIQDPVFYSNWLRQYIQFCKPPYEVAIVDPEYEKLQQQLLTSYLPHVILLGNAQKESLELLKEKLQEGSTYIYVCRNKVCKLPVTKVEDALKLMP
ncbi:MAG: thioredoxin domain-containing protein [Saprospiraceae bacterium]|nr:thioredoxin domain-containing protein [Saprospiraceae bacterium]